MITAKDSRWHSDKTFEINFKDELDYIESNINMSSNEGMRSIYIDNSSDWVSTNDDVTRRIITHLKELGYNVKVIAGQGGYVGEWKSDCSGIEVFW